MNEIFSTTNMGVVLIILAFIVLCLLVAVVYLAAHVRGLTNKLDEVFECRSLAESKHDFLMNKLRSRNAILDYVHNDLDRINNYLYSNNIKSRKTYENRDEQQSGGR